KRQGTCQVLVAIQQTSARTSRSDSNIETCAGYRPNGAVQSLHLSSNGSCLWAHSSCFPAVHLLFLCCGSVQLSRLLGTFLRPNYEGRCSLYSVRLLRDFSPP